MSVDMTPGELEENIEANLDESRVFSVPDQFRAGATVSDPSIYERAAADYEKFWADLAGELEWIEPWSSVLKFEAPFARWFDGGKLNACVNCVDRHLAGPRRNKAAIIWEGEDGDQRVLTYRDLYRKVSKFANVLRELGVQKGDRVAIYLPLIPEAAVAMLACARIGAPHSVVFGGFSPESLRDRINDAQARVLITADGGYRRGNVVPLKRNADEALKECPCVEHVVMVHRVGDVSHVPFVQGRDHWYHRLMECAPLVCEPEPMESEDTLYILYTSGSTGKPKGIVHSTAGYLLGTYATSKYIFDLKEDDVYWCTADVGWVTGHSYLIYGPLANGATCVMYEGAPDFPEKDRFWKLIEKYAVTILYTAPTAIRAFMKWGTEWPERHDLTSLRLLGSVGEPINPEAWMWYYEHIGGKRCPVVDTWWQTETGMIMISPLPGITPLKPGSATHPFPGISAEVVDQSGHPVPPGSGGYLVINKPWPSMLRNLYGDPERFQQQYWSQYPGVYFTGDGARRDVDGNFWLLGRVDDVMNVAGHRISTMEVESALVDHPDVAEAAVIGKKHEIKGQAISAFVTVKEGVTSSPELAKRLKEHVGIKIGAICRPDDIIFAGELPKTRSGKIMRRLLRDVAEGRALGDTSTLADPTVVEGLKQKYEED